MSTSAARKNPISGMTLEAIWATGMPDMVLATKRLTPIGGVTNPMARFTTMITPKCTGSIPTSLIIGRSTGASISIAGA